MIPREDYFPGTDPSLTELLHAEGLRLFGVAALDDSLRRAAAPAAAQYTEWIAAGLHGEMAYLERHEGIAYRPEAVLPGCRAVIVVGCNYYQEPQRENEPATGRVARYAWGRDYHNALGTRLRRVVRRLREVHPDDGFRSFVDASPLSERFFAEHAGIGYTGRHTLTISSAYGSWFFLGEILTTRSLPSTAVDEPVHGGCPTNCLRCGEICPTGALTGYHRMDARRCISYLTIEHRGSISEELRPLMGDWVFGCDLCQEACPLNVRSRVTAVEDFRVHRAGERMPLAELLDMADDEAYRRRFAGTPLLRPGRNAMVRNACIAAGNTGAAALSPRLQRLTNDRNPLVREHAQWALARLGQT